MTLLHYLRKIGRSDLRSEEGAQLLEFAIALPLLAVFLVGIFDFGQALNFKQELNNAAREGARLGSMQSTRDLTQDSPDSVKAIRDVVASYMTAAGVDNCGIGGVLPTSSGVLTWTVTHACPSGGNLTLTIDRGTTVTVTSSDGRTLDVVCTTVRILYPFQWRLDRMIQFVVPGARYTMSIGTDATMMNLS